MSFISNEYNNQDFGNTNFDNVGNDFSGFTSTFNDNNFTSPQQTNDYNFGDFGGDNNNNYQMDNQYIPSSYDNMSLNNIFGSFSPQRNYSTQNQPYMDQGDSGWGPGIKTFMSSLLNNKGLASLIGGLFEGQQNKKQAKSLQQIVQEQQRYNQANSQQAQQRQDVQQQVVSPFDISSSAAGGGTMRNAMQQQLMSAIQDPYSSPIVKNQVEALTQAQRRKDAVAGRRSNDATSNPQLLAVQSDIAQKYINSLMNPAGANIAPNYPGLGNTQNGTEAQLRALIDAAKYNTQGSLSPLLNSLGFNQTY